jgi:hypothetical protein
VGQLTSPNQAKAVRTTYGGRGGYEMVHGERDLVLEQLALVQQSHEALLLLIELLHQRGHCDVLI